MIKSTISNRTFLNSSLALFIIFSISTLSAYSQQMPKMNTDSVTVKNQNASDKGSLMKDDEEIAHSFFTHMGMPEAVGTYSLRLAALATRVDDSQMDGTTSNDIKTKADFAFHFETGLSKFVGLHIRNDRFLDNTHTEVMFQFAAVRSKDGMSGFSPIIEFEIPTKKGASRINTLVGFSSAYVKARFALNQVIHYNPREDMLDGSVSMVYRISKKVFIVAEILGSRMPDGELILNPLAGVKMRVHRNLLLGIAYQQPATTSKDYLSQYIFQPDLEWRR